MTGAGAAPTGPRLTGPRVQLVPVPLEVAQAVVLDAPVGPVLAALGLVAAPGWPHADTADGLRPLAEHPTPGPPSTWLVVDDEEVVGECGLVAPPDDDGDLEIGYGLTPSRRGQGLGTEAVALLCAWAERRPGVRRVVAEVLVGNAPSQRLLARLGFEPEPAAAPYERWVRRAGPGPSRRVVGRHVC